MGLQHCSTASKDSGIAGASDTKVEGICDVPAMELPQEVTDDLQVLMPVLWCLNNNYSCHRVVCPVPVFDVTVFLVWQSMGMACGVIRN